MSRCQFSELRCACILARESTDTPAGTSRASPRNTATRSRKSASRAPGAAARKMSRSLKIAARSQANRAAPKPRDLTNIWARRMHAQLLEHSAMRRDAPGGIDGLELLQQVARLRKRRRGRRIEPRQARGIS